MPLPLLFSANSGAGFGGAGPIAAQAEAGMILARRYRLIQPIAAGGMAQVWLAEDMALVRKVAIKILHPHLATDDAFVTRFRREAVASARLSHPSIVAVYDTVSEGGIEAIVMELIEGRTLRAVLDEVGVLPPADVVDVGMQISDALDEAHRAGIVHRDIKPANIMVCTDRRILVTDFGIAKANKDADLTQTGTLLGTAKYLAPEQVAGEPVDPRADIYALGVVLFEAVTGAPPFLAETDAGTALARLQTEAPRSRHRRSSVPVGLDEVIARSMARIPDERFERALSFKSALAAVNLSDIRPDTSDIDAPQDSAPLVAGRSTNPSGPPPQPVATPPVVNHSGTAVLPQGVSPNVRQTDRSQVSVAPDVAPPSKKLKRAAKKANRKAKGGIAPIDGRQRPTKTIVAVLIGGGLIVAGLLFVSLFSGTGDSGDATEEARDDFSTEGFTIVGATPFDPLDSAGSRTERNQLAPLAIDSDTETKWQTETYARERLGGLKAGVGLVLELDQDTELREMELLTNTDGWTAEIYVGSEFGPNDGSFTADNLDGPVAIIEGGGRAETVALDNAKGSQVLIWLTETGQTEDPDRGVVYRYELFEVVVR